MTIYLLDNMNHNLHDQYSKPQDECLSCQNEKEIQEAFDKQVDADIEREWEDRQHKHV